MSVKRYPTPTAPPKNIFAKKLDTDYYFLHHESDQFFIMKLKNRRESDGDITEIGEVKERTLEELVTYLHKKNVPDSIFALIDEDTVKALKLKV